MIRNHDAPNRPILRQIFFFFFVCKKFLASLFNCSTVYFIIFAKMLELGGC
jgi:hypothetical protein